MSWRHYPRLKAGLELALGTVAVALRSLLTNDLQEVGFAVDGLGNEILGLAGIRV